MARKRRRTRERPEEGDKPEIERPIRYKPPSNVYTWLVFLSIAFLGLAIGITCHFLHKHFGYFSEAPLSVVEPIDPADLE